MKRLFYLSVLLSFSAWATDPYPRNHAIDVQHYLFRLELSDTDDVLRGQATLTIRFRQALPQLLLDLAGADADGKGMTVEAVSVDGKPAAHRHDGDVLIISLPPVAPGSLGLVSVTYSGIPRDGLIIGRNKYGDRTFFGDNWPDRARHWLPCIDHPYDKAQVDFVVTAPEKYQVVANGEQVEESNLQGNRKLTHWRERAPIATKVMVIGVALFAVQKSGEAGGIPVSTWVYRQDRNQGFSDFAVAPRILNYFIESIGPFAYEKLANVQSKTRYGGMENASCIFYFEDAVNGRNETERLIAHEMAHQWFGDAVTEADWHHVWLSEGFATYFAGVYLEHTYGRTRFEEELREQRAQVLRFARTNPAPVIDTTIVDINKVLNTNTYQKAGWVLHMLRRNLGDSLFFEGIRKFYAGYRNENALTDDFRRVMETVSGIDLRPFFTQWLRNPGHPRLKGEWTYRPEKKRVEVTVRQEQPGIFHFPLDILLEGANGERFYHTIPVDKQVVQVSLPIDFVPLSLAPDPGVNLLFEGELKAR